MAEPLFDKIAFIGIGLIGSSLARAVRRDGLARRTVACARRRSTLDKVVELGIVDEVTADCAEAVRDADLVMISTPLSAYAALAEAMAPALAAGAIVSDVGSVKQAVIRDLGPYMPDGVHLVPGHPVAGTSIPGRKPASPNSFRTAGAF